MIEYPLEGPDLKKLFIAGALASTLVILGLRAYNLNRVRSVFEEETEKRYELLLNQYADTNQDGTISELERQTLDQEIFGRELTEIGFKDKTANEIRRILGGIKCYPQKGHSPKVISTISRREIPRELKLFMLDSYSPKKSQ